MNTTKFCRACRASVPSMTVVESCQSLEVKGLDLVVDGLRNWECSECGAQVETPDQMDYNAELIKAAYQKVRCGNKDQRGLLRGSSIREIRNRLGLTQKQAAAVFGGGPTAFAKYEAEDVIQSAAMDKLLRVASAVPEAAAWLAQQARVSITSTRPEVDLWRSLITAHLASKPVRVAKVFSADESTKIGRFNMGETVAPSPCNDKDFAHVA